MHSHPGNKKSCLIDGGLGQKGKEYPFYPNLKKTLHCLVKLLPKTTTEKTGKTKLKADRTYPQLQLDHIVVTHPDQDHYGGINRLLKDSYNICCPIITTQASCLYVERSGIKAEQRIGEEYLSQIDCPRHWFPKEAGKKHDYIGGLPIKSRVKIAKYRHFKGDSNESSILTTVCLPQRKYDFDVVLTGDSNATIILETLELKGKRVRIFQVPHHGSVNNSTLEQGTEVQTNLEPLKKWKPREVKKKRKEKMDFFYCAQFFCSFIADIYLICHGDHKGYKHPHEEVVTGILVAATIKKHPCKIVVTHTGFNPKKIHRLCAKHFSNWSEYVEIYHFIEETPYVTLNPSGTDEQFGQLIKWERPKKEGTSVPTLRRRQYRSKCNK